MRAGITAGDAVPVTIRATDAAGNTGPPAQRNFTVRTPEPDSSVDVVGTYQPLKAGFNYKKLGVKPRPPKYYR